MAPKVFTATWKRGCALFTECRITFYRAILIPTFGTAFSRLMTARWDSCGSSMRLPATSGSIEGGGLFSPSVSFTLIVFILWYGGCCKVNKVNINNNNCVKLRRVNRLTLLIRFSYSNISYLFGAIYLHQGEHIFNRFFWTSWWTTRTWRVMHFTKIYLYIYIYILGVTWKPHDASRDALTWRVTWNFFINTLRRHVTLITWRVTLKTTWRVTWRPYLTRTKAS